jgi:hypothetical protein
MNSTTVDTEKFMRERIEHVLSIFPKISKSMLQVGIGTSISPQLWKPVYERMVSEGVVVEESADFTTPNGRHQNYVIVQLKRNVTGATTATEQAVA